MEPRPPAACTTYVPAILYLLYCNYMQSCNSLPNRYRDTGMHASWNTCVKPAWNIRNNCSRFGWLLHIYESCWAPYHSPQPPPPPLPLLSSLQIYKNLLQSILSSPQSMDRPHWWHEFTNTPVVGSRHKDMAEEHTRAKLWCIWHSRSRVVSTWAFSWNK